MLRGKLAPFFQEPKFRIVKSSSVSRFRYPKAKITASDELQIALALVRSNYYGGDLENVFAARVDAVLDTYYYDAFMKDYEVLFTEINKDLKG